MAGGKSLRMGEDKGLMLLNQKPLVGYVIDALKPLVSEILIVANSPGYEQFGYKVVEDLIPDSGPLGGVLTGLSQSKNDWSFVVSCDTPFVSTALLKYLLKKSEGYDVVLPSCEEAIEPLVGLYNKQCLPELKRMVTEGQLKMRRAVRQLNMLEIPIDDSQSFYTPRLFENLNTQESVKEAEKRMKM